MDRRPYAPALPPYPSPVENLGPLLIVVFLTLGLAILLTILVPPPSEIVVVVDAGHGGNDPGAVAAGVQEKDVNLAIALLVQKKSQAIPGFRVVLIRTTDEYPALLERTALADDLGAALYLSIHANYHRDPKVCGVETWVDSSAKGESLRLAQAMQKALVAATGAQDRGVHRQTLYLSHTSLPAALVEVGYLSCPTERAKLIDPTYQEKIAEGIIRGILAFLQAP